MGEKRILLADADPRVAQEFSQALGEQWQVVTVNDGPSAMAALKDRPCDVLVAGLDLGEMSGSELLNAARKRYPDIVRFVLATEDDRSRVMKEVLGAHQFLTKPVEAATLKNTIERALDLDNWIASESMRSLVAKVRSFPTAPTIYLELLTALRNPNTTTEEVGAIITRDMAITTKLLQVLNSAYFGLPNKITDPAQAVGILGFDTLKSMVVAIKMLAHYDKLKTAHFSIDQLWRHSTEVARHAKQIVMMHTGGRVMAETAFTAGLMHDMGKVVLAANFDEQYRGVQSLASKKDMPLWDVEKEIFGATHGEVGAYLLGLWGMPLELLEAAALHHCPSRSKYREFSALTAVHVANVLEYEIGGKQDSQAPLMDEAYLEEVGVLDCLASWRQAVTTQDFSMPEVRTPAKPRAAALSSPATAPKVEGTIPPAAEHAPASASDVDAEPQTELPSAIDSEEEPDYMDPVMEPAQPGGRSWLYAGAAVAALLVLGGFVYKFSQDSESTTTASPQRAPGTAIEVQARPLGPVTATKPAQPAPTPTKAPAPAPAPVLAAPEPIKPAVVQPESNPVAAAVPTTSPAPDPTPEPPKAPAFPELKLQGVFMAANKPAAIINGKMVHVNELILGARVIDIGRSNVTVEFKEQRKTFKLK